MLQIRCPFCDAEMSVPESLVGKSGRCGDCREQFVVKRPASRGRAARAAAVVDDGDPSLEIVSDDDAVDESLVLEIDDGIEESIWLDDGPFRVSVEPGFPDVPREIIDDIREVIGDKLQAAEQGVFRETDLSVSVDRYDPGSRFMRYMFPFFAGAAQVAISISGTVNGVPVETQTRAARYIGAFGGDSDKMLDACLQDCLGNTLLAIDAAAGREPPPFANFWNQVRIARWIVAGVALVAYGAVSGALRLQKPGRIGFGGGLFFTLVGSLFMAASALGIVTLGPLLFAPGDFLLNDPRGMKIMSRAGTKSPFVMKIVAAIILLVSCGGAFMTLMMLMEAR